MIKPEDCYKKYGTPAANNRWLTMFDVPTELEIGLIPKRIWCNKDMVLPLTNAFKRLILSGCVHEIKTWDGCFNVRPMRGYEKKHAALIKAGKLLEASRLMSIHSWAVAIDVNAFENGLWKEPKLSKEFVRCFVDAGFEWGGTWKRKDGMHFQLSNI